MALAKDAETVLSDPEDVTPEGVVTRRTEGHRAMAKGASLVVTARHVRIAAPGVRGAETGLSAVRALIAHRARLVATIRIPR